MYESEKNRLMENLLLLGVEFDKALYAVNNFGDPIYVYDYLGIQLPNEYKINQNIELPGLGGGLQLNFPILPPPVIPNIKPVLPEQVKNDSNYKSTAIEGNLLTITNEHSLEIEKMQENSNSNRNNDENEIKITKNFKISKKKPKELFLGPENPEKLYSFSFEGPTSSEFASFTHLNPPAFRFDSPTSIPTLDISLSASKINEGLNTLQNFAKSLIIKETNWVQIPKMIEYCIQSYSNS